MSFYIMRAIEGDECLLFHVPTLAAAQEKIESYQSGREQIPAEELSIWTPEGWMVAWLHKGMWIHNRPQAGHPKVRS
jgi:hypothetical protein